MKVIRLRDESLIVEFQNQCLKLIGVKFPLEYLKRARAYGLWDGKELRGGFCYVSKGPLRTVQGLPATVNVPERLTELTGLWLDRKITDRRVLLKFWLALSAKALPEVGRTVIFAFSGAKGGLKKMYQMASPTEIYYGPVAAIEGMPEGDVESINILDGHKLFLLPLRSAAFYYHRLFTSKRFKGYSRI